MVKAGEQLVAGRVVESESPSNARAKGKELLGAKSLGEAGVSSEDDAEELFGVELLAGEDAQLAEDGGERFLGFVDDEHGTTATRADMVRPSGAQCLEAGPSIVRGEGYGEEISELAVEVHRAALRMLDGADEDIRGAREGARRAVVGRCSCRCRDRQ